MIEDIRRLVKETKRISGYVHALGGPFAMYETDTEVVLQYKLNGEWADVRTERE